VALPAVRLSGVFLALATFGFGILSQQVLYTTVLAGQNSARIIARPKFLGISFANDRAFYFLVLGIVVAGATVVEVLRVTRMGRVLRGLADSPVAIQSLAINPTFARVQVFCLSAFLAGIAGGLIGTLTSSVNAQTFGFVESLVWVAVLIAAGPETLMGCVVAAVALVTVPSVFTAAAVREWQPVVFGLGAILLAQAPNGLVGLVKAPPINLSTLSQRSAWRLDTGPLKSRIAEATR
jgi:ABC-type branched-subunit amino acid transport system permease subunit